MILPARTGFFSTPVLLVDGRPCAFLGFFPGNAIVAVAFLDVLGLALLLVGVSGFVSSWHDRYSIVADSTG